MYNNAESNLEI